MLTCHLDFEPAERGGRRNGLQEEPNYPAIMKLHDAYDGANNMYNELDATTIDEIETLALKETLCS